MHLRPFGSHFASVGIKMIIGAADTISGNFPRTTTPRGNIVPLLPPTLFQYTLTNPGNGFDDATDLARLLDAIATAGKLISSEINRAALRDILGAAGGVNTTGDVQQRLDVIGDVAVVDALAATGLVCAMSSEENPGLIEFEGGSEDAPYAVTFDPVDGSSNIDVAAPIGTIFGIFKRVSDSGTGIESDVLQPGTSLIAAGYVLYGSSTIFCYSSGDGVHYFTLDPSVGEFLLTSERVTTHGTSNVYSINEGNSPGWFGADANWVAHVKSKGYSARYIGALVADFHRNLQKGGIYAYPGDNKSPSGKLRLLFECAPLAYIAEQAGGAATDGTRRILEIAPEQLHHRTPFYIGGADEVELLRRYHA